MKKQLLLILILALTLAAPAFSLGLIYGPLVMEDDLLGVTSGDEYQLPLAMGGIYHRIAFEEGYAFYHTDLSYALHKFSTSGADTISHLFYFHNDLNMYIFKHALYMGMGLELVGAVRTGLNEGFTTDYFCYFTGGFSFLQFDLSNNSRLEIGFKILYRIPWSDKSDLANGEASLYFGFHPLGSQAD
jgi:hypothetical protein